MPLCRFGGGYCRTQAMSGLVDCRHRKCVFWLQVFTDLRNRGLEDILVATTDGLTGFTEALQSAFPRCVHQTCIVHLLRNTMALVATKDRAMVTMAAVARDFKLVYTAPNEEEALRMLDTVEQTWKTKYPAITQSWRNNWLKVVPMFSFMPELRPVHLHLQSH